MEKVKFKLVPYEVVFICEHCNIGELERDIDSMHIMLLSHPAQFRHKCTHCGVVENLHECYPKINYSREEFIDDEQIN